MRPKCFVLEVHGFQPMCVQYALVPKYVMRDTCCMFPCHCFTYSGVYTRRGSGQVQEIAWSERVRHFDERVRRVRLIQQLDLYKLNRKRDEVLVPSMYILVHKIAASSRNLALIICWICVFYLNLVMRITDVCASCKIFSHMRFGTHTWLSVHAHTHTLTPFHATMFTHTHTHSLTHKQT
jgi:hypothetical protein